MKRISFLVVLILALGVMSCTSVRKTMSSLGVQNMKIEPLTPAQYEILGEVEGYGEASRFLIFGATFNKYSDIPGVEGKAAGQATYDAISKLEGADMLIAPRYEMETFSVLGIYKTARVKVKAKAISIKSTQ